MGVSIKVVIYCSAGQKISMVPSKSQIWRAIIRAEGCYDHYVSFVLPSEFAVKMVLKKIFDDCEIIFDEAQFSMVHAACGESCNQIVLDRVLQEVREYNNMLVGQYPMGLVPKL